MAVVTAVRTAPGVVFEFTDTTIDLVMVLRHVLADRSLVGLPETLLIADARTARGRGIEVRGLVSLASKLALIKRLQTALGGEYAVELLPERIHVERIVLPIAA